MKIKKIVQSLVKTKHMPLEYNKILLSLVIKFQQEEDLAAKVYHHIANTITNEDDKTILKRIANEEEQHYLTWKSFSQKDVKAPALRIYFYKLLCKILGYTFTLKIMEKKEIAVGDLLLIKPFLEEQNIQIDSLLEETKNHEQELLNMLKEPRLDYVGSIVLGLNDALVEFTGGLAGYTFAYLNNRMVALTGLITGVAASLAMASAEFLSKRSEQEKNPLKSSIATGLSYITTVIILIIPYLVFPPHQNLIALGTMLILAITIIFLFNYYICIAKNLNFKVRFAEMTIISLSVAFISFLIGVLIKYLIPIHDIL